MNYYNRPLKYIMSYWTCLKIGTGNACAWQRSAKLSPSCLLRDEISDSVENEGALEPTGSAHNNNNDLVPTYPLLM